MKGLSLTLLAGLLLAGCGSPGPPACTIQGFQFLVLPRDPAAAPDHTLMPPGNQQYFDAGLGSTYGPNCISNQLYKYTHAQWSTADAVNVTISSADDATNGLATCLAATNTTVSATLTADDFTETKSIPLVCK